MDKIKELLGDLLFLPSFAWTDVIEIIILAVLLYECVYWIQKVRAWFVLKGLIVLLVFYALSRIMNMSVISWLMEEAFSVGIVALFVLFQPELREILEQLGRRNNFTKYLRIGGKAADKRFSDSTLNSLVSAAFDLGKDKVGALIVIEKDISLEAFEKTGIELDAAVTRELLLQIFVHNTPLHDGAVVIRNDRVAAATCILRVSKNSSISKELGTRHRAALGVSEDTDAFTIIVSEETGAVSLTQDGNLMHDIDRETLRRELENIQALRKDESERRWYQFWKKAPAISEEKEEEIREALDEANIEEDRPVSVHAETEMLSAAPLKEYGAESNKKELPVDTPDELTEEFEKEAAEEGRGVTDETDPV